MSEVVKLIQKELREIEKEEKTLAKKKKSRERALKSLGAETLIDSSLKAAGGRLNSTRKVTTEQKNLVVIALTGIGEGNRLRAELEAITRIPSPQMSHVLAELVQSGRILQTNPPAKRMTRWRLVPVTAHAQV